MIDLSIQYKKAMDMDKLQLFVHGLINIKNYEQHMVTKFFMKMVLLLQVNDCKYLSKKRRFKPVPLRKVDPEWDSKYNEIARTKKEKTS